MSSEKELRKIRELLEKQNKEWTVIMLQIGNQIQELRKIMGFFYQDFLVFNQRRKWWQFWRNR